MLNIYDILINEELDILKEIGNIGMGHATTAISQMLGMKVTMTIPDVYVFDYKKAVKYLELTSTDSLGVTITLQGDSKGMILQVLSKKFAMKVINFFFQGSLETLGDLDEMSLSVIQEISNITSGAYCNSLASMTGLFIDISTPIHCANLVESILNSDLINLNNSKLLIVKNSFFIENEEFNSNFLFMPDENTINMILLKLKEYYGFALT